MTRARAARTLVPYLVPLLMTASHGTRKPRCAIARVA